MKISLWGVRGSIPTSGSNTKYYGGSTSCAVVTDGESVLVLDAGSGIAQFDLSNYPGIRRLDILLTHLHLDHIQGLGFFKPLFNPNMEIHIWGPSGSTKSLHARLSRYLSPPLFPVLIRDLPCRLILHEVGNTEFQIGNLTIYSAYLIHPGPTVGYRISDGKSNFTYMPDHEPSLGQCGMINDPNWISGYDLAANADLLYHDGQYSTKEYSSRVGWGHSSLEDALQYAKRSGVKHLVIGHHDPSHSDDQLHEMFNELKEKNKNGLQYELAVEGMEFELP